jgi:hypothetical protein
MLTLDTQRAKLAAFNPRTELHGEEHVPAADLVFEVKAANNILLMLSPMLLPALYQRDDTPSDMFPDPNALTVYKFPAIEAFAWRMPKAIKAAVTIHIGVSGYSDIALGDCEVDKLVITPNEGGTVALKFRVKAWPKADDMGRLCTMIQSTVDVSVTPIQEDMDEEEPTDVRQTPAQAAAAMFM